MLFLFRCCWLRGTVICVIFSINGEINFKDSLSVPLPGSLNSLFLINHVGQSYFELIKW